MISVIELKKGDNVKNKLNDFFLENNWTEAYVMSGLGSLVNVELTNAADLNIPPQIQKTIIEGPLEVLSLFGDIKKSNDNVLVHVHLSGSLKNSQMHGGGLFYAEVFKGLKIYLSKIK